MHVLFILNDPPYGTEHIYNALRLAHTLLKRDGSTEITVFLMADAVVGARKGQKTPDGYYSMLKRVLTGKGHVLLENYFLPGNLENQVAAFVGHYNHQRYHESLKKPHARRRRYRARTNHPALRGKDKKEDHETQALAACQTRCSTETKMSQTS